MSCRNIYPGQQANIVAFKSLIISVLLGALVAHTIVPRTQALINGVYAKCLREMRYSPSKESYCIFLG